MAAHPTTEVLTSPENLEAHIARKRGRLKIFLGMAPGVGKTYTMLAEAHRRQSRGEDIVVGFVETHGRTETAKLVEGLEVVPRKKIVYRGRTFEEMDTEAVIKRHPEWAIVDELAHTNIPGAEHAKRWQSMLDIVDSGINVLSTVNVQHLESLNDEVLRITGVRVRETFPDYILDEADEVVMVDLTPTALINRLRRGSVYGEDRVPSALSHFFTPENLAALREMALSRTAEEVEDQLEEMEAPGQRLTSNEVVLVCVTGRPNSARLVRRGYRLAERLRGKLFVLHVSPPSVKLSAADEERIDTSRELARDLGGSFYEVKGESPDTEIVDFAKEHGVTLIVLGQSARTRAQEVIRGSIVNRIMRETSGIDMVVVADQERV